MSLRELTERMETLGNTWEQFKSINDRRLQEIERKGNADALTTEHLGRISNALDEQKSRMHTLETAISRPEMGGATIASPDVRDHKTAFCNYLRKGVEEELSYLEKKALSAASDPDGGYLVTPTMAQTIAKTVFESSPMRQLAAVETISSDSLEVIVDKDEAGAGWYAEADSISDTTTPQVNKKIIPVHELRAQPKATQKLIDDASVDIEGWLSGKLTDVFTRKENTAFISGDGVGKPRGILSYDAGTGWGQIEQIDSGTDGQVTADGLVQIFYALKEEYATRATFLMSRSAVQQARLLKEATTNQYLWNPGLVTGTPDTLMGVPVLQAADMPTPDTDTLSVAVGDFSRAYQIVDRAGVRILRDPYTEKPFVKFYSTKRVGGDVVNFEAIKLLKLAS